MFPVTITLSTPAQLNAVLMALRPELQASDFASPAIGAAYAEVTKRIAQREAAEVHAVPTATLTQAQQAAVDDTAGLEVAAAPVEKPASAASARTAAAPRTDAPARTGSTSKPAPDTSTTTPPADATAAAEVDYDQVKLAIVGLVKAKGAAAASAVLTAFGVAKGPELKPEQYADFVQAVKGAL